jgi:hypothetical protein
MRLYPLRILVDSVVDFSAASAVLTPKTRNPPHPRGGFLVQESLSFWY